MGVQVLAIGVLPLATLVQGAVANTLGVAATTVIAGLLLFLATAVVYISSLGLRAFRGRTVTTSGPPGPPSNPGRSSVVPGDTRNPVLLPSFAVCAQ